MEVAHRQADLKSTWRTRKLKYLDQLKTASPEALMICAADKIHFLQSLVSVYAEQGESLWNKFNATPAERMWFCGEVLRILQRRLDNPIVDKLTTVLAVAQRLKSPYTQYSFEITK